MVSDADRTDSDRSSGEKQVTDFQRTETADISNDAVNPEQHVCRISPLYRISVDIQMETDLLNIGKAFHRHPVTDGSRIVEALAEFPGLAFRTELTLQVAGCEVNSYGYGIIIAGSKALGNVLSQPADADHQLRFCLLYTSDAADEL